METRQWVMLCVWLVLGTVGVRFVVQMWQSPPPLDACAERCLQRGFEPMGHSKYRPAWCRCDATTDVFDPAIPEDDIDYSLLRHHQIEPQNLPDANAQAMP